MFTSVLCRQLSLFFKKFFCGCLKKSLFQISYLISHIEDMIQDCLFFLGTKRKGGKFQHKIVFLRIYSMRTKFLLKLWQNMKGRMFVFHVPQNDVFFSAASCKKDIIFGTMTNKHSAFLISLGLYRFFSKKKP